MIIHDNIFDSLLKQQEDHFFPVQTMVAPTQNTGQVQGFVKPFMLDPIVELERSWKFSSKGKDHGVIWAWMVTAY